jgi:DNA topoisomerase-1
VSADLSAPDLGRRRVLAAAVRLIDVGCFRVGDEVLVFHYPAKGSIPWTVTINDPEVAGVVRSLRRRRRDGPGLFAWKGKTGWNDIRAGDINAYIKEEIGEQFSAKDFRTCSATVYAAVMLARCVETGRSERATARAVAAVAEGAADYLGNTPAVCRSSYIDPRLIDRFVSGETIRPTSGPVDEILGDPKRRRDIEDGLLELMSHLGEAAA